MGRSCGALIPTKSSRPSTASKQMAQRWTDPVRQSSTGCCTSTPATAGSSAVREMCCWRLEWTSWRRGPVKKLFVIAALAFASVAHAQEGLVVGSGNFFSPIVADLDKAIAFYRDGLGLDIQGTPANADQNPTLRNMFGLPDAQLRWTV